MTKRTIKIKFTDFWGDFNYKKNFVTELLSKKYTLEASDTPDYIFSSAMGLIF